MITTFIEQYILYPTDLQFLLFLTASVILIMVVALFYSLVCGIFGSLFNRR